jgi:hypothetical protein
MSQTLPVERTRDDGEYKIIGRCKKGRPVGVQNLELQK